MIFSQVTQIFDIVQVQGNVVGKTAATDGRTDGITDRQADGRTNPLIEISFQKELFNLEAPENPSSTWNQAGNPNFLE